MNAKEFATKKHKGQLCDEGKPYINHPIQVAKMIKLLTNDKDIIDEYKKNHKDGWDLEFDKYWSTVSDS